MSDDDRIACRTPAKGTEGTTRIPRWKYECVRRAILDALEAAEDGQVLFKNLADHVRERLSSNQLAKLGSLGWHVTTVKLNMDCLLYTSPSPRDATLSRMPSSA